MKPENTSPRLHVFLSYTTVEAKLADIIKKYLIKDFIGLVEVFLSSDTTSIPAGSFWLEQVIKGLQQSQLHLVICSHDSISRPWIHYEAGAARVREIPITPLCHSGLKPEQLPVPLSESEGGTLTNHSFLEKLYTVIAEQIGSSVPEVDFQKYAEEFKTQEEELEKLKMKCLENEEISVKHETSGKLKPETINDPQVLCVTSPQFREIGMANQLQTVLDSFPKNVKHSFVMNSDDLRDILLNERVDILHIAAFVCPRRGDLYFSEVELPFGKSVVDEPDSIRPEALATLLKKARTRLVVLGGSQSLVLAAELIPITHVIAAKDIVSANAMGLWVKTFYEALETEYLAAACELASQVSRAPMKLYVQQNQLPPVKLEVTQTREKLAQEANGKQAH